MRDFFFFFEGLDGILVGLFGIWVDPSGLFGSGGIFRIFEWDFGWIHQDSWDLAGFLMD